MTQQKGEILIIEDDDIFFCALKSRLERRGFGISRSKDGKDGLAKCKRGKYRLVITDIVLPKLNGFEIIKTLRSDYDRDFSFVVISNLGKNSIDTDNEFYKSLGIVRYLVKSNHSISDIVNQITECLT